MSLFRFGKKKKKKSKSCGDVVGSPDMWAEASGIGMQRLMKLPELFGGAAQKNMAEMTEPISLPGQNQYGATEPLMAPAYDSVGATEPLNTPVQHLQSAAPILPFTDGNYGGAEPLHVPVEDFYGVTEPLDMPASGKYSAAELQGTSTQTVSVRRNLSFHQVDMCRALCLLIRLCLCRICLITPVIRVF